MQNDFWLKSTPVDKTGQKTLEQREAAQDHHRSQLKARRSERDSQDLTGL